MIENGTTLCQCVTKEMYGIVWLLGLPAVVKLHLRHNAAHAWQGSMHAL